MHACGGGPGVANSFYPRVGDWEREFLGVGKEAGPWDSVGRDAESGEGAGDSSGDRDPWVGRDQNVVEMSVDSFLGSLLERPLRGRCAGARSELQAPRL